MMTHDEMIAIIQAHKEGKKIEWRLKGIEDAEWYEYKNEDYNFQMCEYRIKPEPHDRPFKNAEEVMAAIKEHGSWFHKKNTKFYSNTITIDNDIVDFMEGADCYTFEQAIVEYEFADGTPFGVKEEQ